MEITAYKKVRGQVEITSSSLRHNQAQNPGFSPQGDSVFSLVQIFHLNSDSEVFKQLNTVKIRSRSDFDWKIAVFSSYLMTSTTDSCGIPKGLGSFENMQILMYFFNKNHV